MASIFEEIRQAAATNDELLSGLAEVAYAPPALVQQNSNISALRQEIASTEKGLPFLKFKTGEALKRHDDYRHSKLRRRFGNKEKFAEEAEKEERAYHDAIMKQKGAEDGLETAKSKLEKAATEQVALQAAAKRHAELQSQLDTLYSSIFDGPTPDFPDEDAREAEFTEAQTILARYKTAVDNEQEVIKLLMQACMAMREACSTMSSAKSASTYELFGGGQIALSIERSNIAKAQTALMNAQNYVGKAARLQEQVEHFEGVNVDPGMWTMNMFFNNVFTDLAVRDRIKQAEVEVQKADASITKQLKQAQGRAAELKREMGQAAEQVAEAKKGLQQIGLKAQWQCSSNEAISLKMLPAESFPHHLYQITMTPLLFGSDALHEVALIASYFPLVLYTLDLRVQSGLVSAICDKFAAPAGFVGGFNDFREIWSLKQSELFSNIGNRPPSLVTSLRHGNTFPLANEAILVAAGCIGRHTPIETDQNMPKAVSVNVIFFIPEKEHSQTFFPARLVGGFITCLEICVFGCSAFFLNLYGIYAGSVLVACLAISSVCSLVHQQLQGLVYAHQDAIKNDMRLTARNGAATDIHVVVPEPNSVEMDVLVGYSSQLHSLTNLPVRINKPSLLQWTNRVLGLVLMIQAALLAKLAGTSVPNLYGPSAWLLGYLTITAIKAVVARFFSSVKLGKEPLKLVTAPRVFLPSRRAALAFISSLPMTPQRADRWDWTDSFMPRSARREVWQQEMDLAQLSVKDVANLNLSDDGRRIVFQVRDVRFEGQLSQAIDDFEAAVGLARVEE